MKNQIKLLVTGLTSLCAMSAYAAPTLTLDDGPGGLAPVVFGETVPGSGAIGIALVTYGNWVFVGSTALTDPALGNPPHMDLAFSATSLGGTGANQLIITFSDDGVAYTGGILSSIGGTTAGTINQSVLVDGIAVASTGPFGPGAYSGTAGANVALVPASVLSLQITINHAAAAVNQVSSGDNELTRVPDGGMTIMLLGSGLVALACVRRKFAQ